MPVVQNEQCPRQMVWWDAACRTPHRESSHFAELLLGHPIALLEQHTILVFDLILIFPVGIFPPLCDRDLT
jgi:hypothetical protein